MLARVHAAAEAGYAAVGMYLGAWAAMREDPGAVDELEQALDQTGVVIANIETLRGWASPDRSDEHGIHAEALAFEIADRFGCRYAQAIGDYTGSVAEASAGFAALCDRAADHDLLVGIEAVPSMTNIDNLTLARQIVDGADRDNAGICFDSWHLTRSTNDLDELRALDGSKVFATQFNDGTVEPVIADYYTDTLASRVAPGEGEFRLVEMVQTLDAIGCTAPIGLEVPSTRLWEVPIDDAATTCAEAMRRILAEARTQAP